MVLSTLHRCSPQGSASEEEGRREEGQPYGGQPGSCPNLCCRFSRSFIFSPPSPTLPTHLERQIRKFRSKFPTIIDPFLVVTSYLSKMPPYYTYVPPKPPPESKPASEAERSSYYNYHPPNAGRLMTALPTDFTAHSLPPSYAHLPIPNLPTAMLLHQVVLLLSKYSMSYGSLVKSRDRQRTPAH